MDLSNLINNKNQDNFDGQFNSADLNFENVNQSDLVDFGTKTFNVDQFEVKEKRKQMFKDMFGLLATTSDSVAIVRALKRKYGNQLVDQSVVTACIKLSDIIGNYIITCRYNDNLGNKNPQMIKYVMFCDCDDCEQYQNQLGAGSVDGFFTASKKVKVSKVKMCKKYNLPVLAKLQDLSEQDFKKLVKEVAETKNVSVKENSKKSVVSRIANVFEKLSSKNNDLKIANNLDYSVKQANVQVVATVSNQFKNVEVDQMIAPVQDDFDTIQYSNIVVDNVKNPQQQLFTIVDQDKLSSGVNMPINNISVEVKQRKKSMNPFSVNVMPYDELQLQDNENFCVSVNGRDMQVGVEKEVAKMNKVSLKSQTLDHGVGMKGDFDFVLNDQFSDNITVDTENSFDF